MTPRVENFVDDLFRGIEVVNKVQIQPEFLWLKKYNGKNEDDILAHSLVVPQSGITQMQAPVAMRESLIKRKMSDKEFDYTFTNREDEWYYAVVTSIDKRAKYVRVEKVRLVGMLLIVFIKEKHYSHGDPIEIRRSTGIPRSFMVPVDGPKAPGAMMTPSGTFAVPAVDHEAYLASENAGGADTPTNAPVAPEPTIPDELLCSLCRDLLTDAVMIPCCGNSFCDECIRGALLESEDHECPDCREKEIAPTTLIPNRFLRNSVSAFRNQTGYCRRAPHRPSAGPPILVILWALMFSEVPAPAPAPMQPGNGAVPPVPPNNDAGAVGIVGDAREPREGKARGDESDGSADDNITVTVPPAHVHHAPPPAALAHHASPHTAHAHHAPPLAAHAPAAHHAHAPAAPLAHHAHHAHHGRHANVHRSSRYGPPPAIKPPGIDGPHINMPRIDEQRASTPTIDERRDPMSSQVMYNRGPPPYMPAVPPPAHFNK
ncbi:unnamed protein product [Euphydryas editha]|nr:unnamed protein product [Euphydryas editha]